jgi:hypothetical protein
MVSKISDGLEIGCSNERDLGAILMPSVEGNATTAANTLEALCNEKRIRCLYTSTTFLNWLKFLRAARAILIILPIALGAIAGWTLLKSNPKLAVYSAVAALLAGVIPAIYSALKFDEYLPSAAQMAGEYKNLEIAFGDLQKMCAYKPVSEIESEYQRARDRLERANAQSFTAPEFFFKRAKRMLAKGDGDASTFVDRKSN